MSRYDGPGPEERAEAARASCWPAIVRRARLRPAPVEELGCGKRGCAYSVHDLRGRERVLKLTRDDSEVRFAAWLRELGGARPAMLPEIDGAWVLECAPDEQYAIVREYLVDFEEHHDDVRIADAVGLYVSAEFNGGIRELNRVEAADVRHNLDAVRTASDPATRRNLRNAEQFMRWADAQRVIIADVYNHDANWGTRPGTDELVVRDLGFAESSGSPSAPVGPIARLLGGAPRGVVRLRGLRS